MRAKGLNNFRGYQLNASIECTIKPTWWLRIKIAAAKRIVKLGMWMLGVTVSWEPDDDETQTPRP